MAIRGEVLSLRRRIGFGNGETLERFVVLQSERYAPALETVIVAPLDAAAAVYGKFPGAVAVDVHGPSGIEASVALLPFLSSVPLARFEVGARGRLDRRSLGLVDRTLRLLLGIV